MANRPTRDMNDYVDDYENAARDYAEMGPLWSELVFPDDFEALRALNGAKQAEKVAETPDPNWAKRYTKARGSYRSRD